MNFTIELTIFELVYEPSLILNKQLFFGPNLSKNGVSTPNKKSEQHHQVWHFGFSPGTKFHFKLAVLDQFSPKKMF